MTRRGALAIGLLASVGVSLQNLAFAGGFVWAAIHGAGVSSLLAFVPAALGLGLLWTGYFVVNRSNIGRKTMVFTLYAVAVLSVNEVLLPGTPLKGWWTQRAIQRVVVQNVRDELLVSARGNPIGVRISFDAVVPRTGTYGISASTLTTAAETPWPLHFGHSIQHTVQPPPARGDGAYDTFQQGIVYTFTQEMLPNFLGYDAKVKQACAMNVTTRYVSHADILSALSNNRDVKLRTEIQVEAPDGADRVVAVDYATRQGYDLKAMYDTIAAEGNKRCGS